MTGLVTGPGLIEAAGGLILPGALDLPLDDLNKGRRQDHGDDRPHLEDFDYDQFKKDVALIFPKGASARLSRIADVNQRLCQRWIVGEVTPPLDVQAYVKEQAALVAKLQPMVALAALGEKWGELDAEVIQSQIAHLYHAMSGRDPE